MELLITMLGCADFVSSTWHPQWGQITAFLAIVFPHSLQNLVSVAVLASDIKLSSFFVLRLCVYFVELVECSTFVA